MRDSSEALKLVPVATTFSPGDVALIKSVLNGAGVLYYAEAERFNLYRPWILPVRFMVREEEAAWTQDLLADLGLTYWGISIHGSPRWVRVATLAMVILWCFPISLLPLAVWPFATWGPHKPDTHQ